MNNGTRYYKQPKATHYKQGITNSLKARDEKRYKVLQTARDETILFQVRWAFSKRSATWAGRRYRGRWQSGQEHETCFFLFIHITIFVLFSCQSFVLNVDVLFLLLGLLLFSSYCSCSCCPVVLCIIFVVLVLLVAAKLTFVSRCVALFDISISNINCRYIDTFEKYRYRYGHFWKYRYR